MMARLLLVPLAAFGLVGCALNQPPLMKEDGQYRSARVVAPAERTDRGLIVPPVRSVEQAAHDETVLPRALMAMQTPEMPRERTRFDRPAFPELEPAEQIKPLKDQSQSGGPYFTTVTPVRPSPVRMATPEQSVPTPSPRPVQDKQKTEPIPHPVQPISNSQMAAPAAETRPRQAAASSYPVDDMQRQAAERAMLMVNGFRQQNGLPPLAYSPELSIIARRQVIDLAARHEVSSLDPFGRGVGERLAQEGYNAAAAGSLVSGGYLDFGSALESWKSDGTQRSRLLLPQADEMGFAIITDRQSKYFTYIEVIVASR